MDSANAVRGVLFGTAAGDALGLPWEGLPAARIGRELGFGLWGRGVVSDDTEQTALVALALARSGGDIERFRRELARGLRWWLLALPPGIGLGTLRALIRLLLGVGPEHSGVWSAGNGAAMRAAILGVVVPEEQLQDWVWASSRITHADPRAIEAALAVARAARIGARCGHGGKLAAAGAVLDGLSHPELRARLSLAIEAARAGETSAALAERLGVAGFVSGYALDTVPVAVFLWLRHDDPVEAVQAAVRMGGDTDTVAAITGALCGATGGAEALSPAWLAALPDAASVWVGPLGPPTGQLEALAEALVRGAPVPRERPWAAQIARNLALLPLLATHAVLRRLRPPRP
jgi:ADP-ribosylglycohydrolase